MRHDRGNYCVDDRSHGELLMQMESAHGRWVLGSLAPCVNLGGRVGSSALR